MITFEKEGKKQSVPCNKGESIWEALISHHIFLDAVCAGRGSCGTCKIRVISGELPVSAEDTAYFTETERNEGWRLSCKAFPESDCEIYLPEESAEPFSVVSAHEGGKIEAIAGNGRKTGMVIDVGTTTLAMQLVDLQSGRVLHTYCALNRQRAYGADVISRIQASNQGKKRELAACVRDDLRTGVQALLQTAGLKSGSQPPEKIVIAGNTVMTHLLMGYSCESLGVYPFRPVNTETITLSYEELFGDSALNIPVVILPGVSAFVGGDIVSGLLACGFDKLKEPAVFIDLGTNGELAIGDGRSLLTASAAAGPAFEGGSLSFGCGSIPGAICAVTIENHKAEVRTIGNRPCVGICGTGAIETVFELRKEHLIDETGLLAQAYFEAGFPLAAGRHGRTIFFTQKDIREIQMAKSAIRAGLEILIKRFGADRKQIRQVYLAGGFGYTLDIKKALGIGLLPEIFGGNIRAAGNSALYGAIRYLREDKAESIVQRLASDAEEIQLAQDEEFQEKYLEFMNF